tara:strand:+ start:3461 stop:4288 length:828 start_codon:yes stop_codon:yes gene_type:complete
MYKHKIYFLIGCPRTGSTFLYNILKYNKRINLLPKENHFFLSKKIFGKKNYFDTPKYKLNIPLEYYLSKLSINKINYDINTLYFYDLEALKIIKKNFPNSKFFCFIRDPIKRHYSHSLTQIKKYYLYKDFGDFKFPITDFYDLKKSVLFKNEMLSFSNYAYYKKKLRTNKIKCTFWSYEKLFKDKKNYIKFLKEIKITSFNKIFNYSKYSQKNYPIKVYNRTIFGVMKSFLFKNHYKKKIDNVIFNFDKNYPYEIMKKTFKMKDKNLKKYLKIYG